MLEALLLLLLLTLGIIGEDRARPPAEFVKFTASELTEKSDPEPEQDRAETQSDAPSDSPAEFAQKEPDRPTAIAIETAPPVVRRKPAPQLMPLDPSQMAAADISKTPRTAPGNDGPAYGPPDTGTPGDTQRVSGSSPTGEPLYAARWYREPSDAELAGYLSTASGPGYAIIACQTVPDFRVDHCALETEYPSGSQIGRSVMAAAWQFRVRPPRIGGRSQVGAWVRIKIDYAVRRP
ncbi:hypothetical protein [Pontixanthobacter sp.]|uniref:hypothetical protein n=1 Tax=Pontixanthobacter sp. TaxID=2792078 RepID=UPI003C7E6A3C